MIYGSVCSGIEAASVAFEPLGFVPAWFSEIEPFPSAVLAHHWPHVTNLGDMTRIAEQVANDNVPAPDVLVGGTPCQAFSVAGARRGLEDDRGILTIKFVELADAIDQQRAANDNEPAIIIWENVPGVLSSKDNAFGAFLGLLSGEECELVPPGGKWTNAGYVSGPKRAIAWRVLDAQYFGVAQRRRRVFVVASAREGVDPVELLFEFEGMRRDFAPSREAGSVVAALTANGVGTCGADDNQGQAGHLIPAIMSVHGTKDPDTNIELAHTLGRNQGQENAVAYSVSLRGREGGATAELGGEVAGCLRASSGGGDKPHVLAQCATGDITHTLKAEGFDGSEDGTGRGTPIVPVAAFAENSRAEIRLEGGEATGCRRSSSGGGDKAHVLIAFSSKDYGGDATVNMSPTLRACGHANSHANAGAPPAVATTTAVRRLMPVECERLQGFPDGHTDVPYRGKPASDGPRYKAIGNSMAVPCMKWIGERIKLHLEAV